LLALSCVLVGCGSAPVAEPPEGLGEYVLPRPPRDIPSPRFIDFGAKVQLLGFEREPAGLVTPGAEVTLRLYWKSVAPLGPGWRLFTHLEGVDGSFTNLDQVGPLRQPGKGNEPALGPSAWRPGHVYVDEQSFKVPDQGRRFSVLVGVWRPDGLRLEIQSGPRDETNRGIVTHLRTQ
jgi:hypothetical protein